MPSRARRLVIPSADARDVIARGWRPWPSRAAICGTMGVAWDYQLTYGVALRTVITAPPHPLRPPSPFGSILPLRSTYLAFLSWTSRVHTLRYVQAQCDMYVGLTHRVDADSDPR